MNAAPPEPPANFIFESIEQDLRQGANDGRVCTRFPPEPNGYLHIGHAKSIFLNFGAAGHFPGGHCILRFDDTNPEKESAECTHAITEDVRWLCDGWNHWDGKVCHASDYFEQLYQYALQLINDGKAYVDDQSAEQVRAGRGTLTQPGRNSPYRERSRQENRLLFERMRNGDFDEGACVLRARIDMNAPNLNLRDPVIYRIRKCPHYRTGQNWNIYPMYDYTQCISDALEGVTHSLCTLEFEDHRALYDWFLDQLPVPYRPRQIEFSRLNLSHTLTRKRLLAQLVESGLVDGWDDPRMPTLSGLRRRGYTPTAIRDFCRRIGLTKKEALIDLRLLENCIREELNRRAPRAMGVLRPLRVVIENYPEGQVEQLAVPNHPDDPSMGQRTLPFCRELFIEQEDFQSEPQPGFRRLSPGSEVRLRYAYLIRCREALRDPVSGAIVELRCRYDPDSRGGKAPDGRKVRSTLHWVSGRHAIPAECRLYDRLFLLPEPGLEAANWQDELNPESLQLCGDALLEPALADSTAGQRYQFERIGYFCVDAKSNQRRDGGKSLVFNRVVSLREPRMAGQRKK